MFSSRCRPNTRPTRRKRHEQRSTKPQSPNPRKYPNPNLQKSSLQVGAWPLGLLWGLGFGAWSFAMKSRPFRGLGAILFKEFIIVWRDPMTLFFMFFPPLVEMVAFGYALDTDVKHMSMLILNEDRTVESRQFIDRFVNTETFRVVGEAQSVDELSSAIRSGRAYVGLQIPHTFTRDVRAGNPAQVQLLVDGSNSTTALQALNTAVAVGLTQSIESLLRETGRRAIPIDVRPQMLYNPAMKSPNFYIPGVIGIVLQIGTTFATAMAVVREREKGTLETLLVSPLSRWGLMLGKLVPYLCIGMTMG